MPYWFDTFDTFSNTVRIHILEERDWEGYLSALRRVPSSRISMDVPVVRIHFSCRLRSVADEVIETFLQEVMRKLEERLPITESEVARGFQELVRHAHPHPSSVQLYLRELDPVSRRFGECLRSVLSHTPLKPPTILTFREGEWKPVE